MIIGILQAWYTITFLGQRQQYNKKKELSRQHKILDVRSSFSESNLADLYDPLTMPPELRKAHTANDKAVMAAYGFSTKMTEADCVAELMKLYQRLVQEK